MLCFYSIFNQLSCVTRRPITYYWSPSNSTKPVYSGTPLQRTPLGTNSLSIFQEVSLTQGLLAATYIYMFSQSQTVLNFVAQLWIIKQQINCEIGSVADFVSQFRRKNDFSPKMRDKIRTESLSLRPTFSELSVAVR